MQSANFSREQWWLRAGFNARSNVTSSNMLQFLGSNESLAMFATPFTDGWHNFGIIMDFDHKYALHPSMENEQFAYYRFKARFKYFIRREQIY